MLGKSHFVVRVLAVSMMLTTACGSGANREDRSQSLLKSNSSTSLSGTWEGSLNCNTGESISYVLKVADTGYPVFQYITKGGSREVELTQQGQVIQFVPQDGGVSTLVVDSLSVASNHISFAVNLSREKTSEFGSSATLSQEKTSSMHEATLSAGKLDTKVTIQSQTVLSQADFGAVPGNNQVGVCRGMLKR